MAARRKEHMSVEQQRRAKAVQIFGAKREAELHREEQQPEEQQPAAPVFRNEPRFSTNDIAVMGRSSSEFDEEHRVRQAEALDLLVRLRKAARAKAREATTRQDDATEEEEKAKADERRRQHEDKLQLSKATC